jgi:hypothetical protein
MSTNPTGKYKPKPHAFTAEDMIVAKDASKLLALALDELEGMQFAHIKANEFAERAKTEPDLNPDLFRTLANENRLASIEHARQAFALLRTISPRAKK